MEEKEISEIEGLAIIQQMIDRAKNSFVEKGTWPIYWGTLITFCSLFKYGEIKLQKFIPFDIFLLTFPALLIQIGIIIYQKKKNRDKPKSVGLSQLAINYVWAAFMVSMMLVSFTPQGNSPVVYLVLYGIPTFVTGGVVKFKIMIFGGIVCWICALSILIFKLQGPTTLLFAATSAVFAWLIPGIVLRRRYLRTKKAV